MTDYLDVNGVRDWCRGGATHRAIVRVEQLGIRLGHSLWPVLLLGHGAAAAIVELILLAQIWNQLSDADADADALSQGGSGS